MIMNSNKQLIKRAKQQQMLKNMAEKHLKQLKEEWLWDDDVKTITQRTSKGERYSKYCGGLVFV